MAPIPAVPCNRDTLPFDTCESADAVFGVASRPHITLHRVNGLQSSLPPANQSFLCQPKICSLVFRRGRLDESRTHGLVIPASSEPSTSPQPFRAREAACIFTC